MEYVLEQSSTLEKRKLMMMIVSFSIKVFYGRK
jgi:hypothetical protein